MRESNSKEAMSPERLLKPKEVAKILNCSPGYPYLLIKRKMIPFVRIPCPDGKGKHLIRFKQSDVFNFIETHYQQGGKS